MQFGCTHPQYSNWWVGFKLMNHPQMLGANGGESYTVLWRTGKSFLYTLGAVHLESNKSSGNQIIWNRINHINLYEIYLSSCWSTHFLISTSAFYHWSTPGKTKVTRLAKKICNEAHRSQVAHWVLVKSSHTLWLCQNSYWKWPFIVDFPIKNGDFQ